MFGCLILFFIPLLIPRYSIFILILVIFVTGPSLHCLEGNSLECSIRLNATHHTLFSDLHPSLPDGVHGPFNFFSVIDKQF